MADNELIVTISGAALSLLFYENVRSKGDQMGFFLGEVLTFHTKKVTDSETHEETVKVHVDIHSVMKCTPSDQLYYKSGKLNQDRVTEFVKTKEQSIVGWFRFRRNWSLVPTLMDKILHKQFMARFGCVDEQSSDNYFVACMLNASASMIGGTHKFKHVFLHYKQGLLQPIPLRINNLGHDASRHDTGDYKPTPLKYSDSPDPFTKFINSLKLDLGHGAGVDSICRIQSAAEEHLEKLIPHVVKSDLEVADLEEKVMKARQAIVKLLTEKGFQSKEKLLRDNKYRTHREPDKNQKTEESSPSVRHSFLKNEETRAIEIKNECFSPKENSNKQRSRFSLPPGDSMSKSMQLNPYATERLHHSNSSKKFRERDHNEPDADC